MCKNGISGNHLPEGAVFCYYILLSRGLGLSLWFSQVHIAPLTNCSVSSRQNQYLPDKLRSLSVDILGGR